MAGNPYDSRKLVLPAREITDAVTAVSGHLTDMVDSITAVNNAVTNLPWDGVSQQDMEQVWDTWMTAVTHLLGPQGDPGKGSMNIVLASMNQASANYTTTELQLKAAFSQMQADLQNAGSNSSGAPASVLVQYQNGDPNAPSTFVEEIYSDDGAASGSEGPWTI